jgi:uncharacterized protein
VKILMTGASGLIGSELVPALRQQHTIIRMVRSQASSPDEMQWTPGRPLDPASLRDVDTVVHLAGKNIGVRWTPQAKREILASRVEGTRTMAVAVSESFKRVGKPKLFVSASAIGYYGDRRDELLTEASESGKGFLAEIVRAWEGATDAAIDAGVRTIVPRIGVVLSPRGGALAKMLPPFKLGVGGPIGGGKQWMSWIALDDVVAAFTHLLRSPELSGRVNLVAPNPLTNAEFTRVLAKVLHRPAVFPLPAVAVRLALGEMGEELLLSSTRVASRRLEESGYLFRHPELMTALREQLRV